MVDTFLPLQASKSPSNDAIGEKKRTENQDNNMSGHNKPKRSVVLNPFETHLDKLRKCRNIKQKRQHCLTPETSQLSSFQGLKKTFQKSS